MKFSENITCNNSHLVQKCYTNYANKDIFSFKRLKTNNIKSIVNFLNKIPFTSYCNNYREVKDNYSQYITVSTKIKYQYNQEDKGIRHLDSVYNVLQKINTLENTL